MRMKTGQKHVFMCMLLCFLLLTSYISVLNANGIISSDMNVSGVAFGSGGNGHSLMDGETSLWHFGCMSANSTCIEFFNLSSVKNMRPLVTKTIGDILTALIAAHIICLICSSRFSEHLCTQFNSIRIICFLHKKDGMK